MSTPGTFVFSFGSDGALVVPATVPGPVAANPQFSVPMSADLQRILALPRRMWSEGAKTELARWMTDHLRTEHGCDRCGGQRGHVEWSHDTHGRAVEGCWYRDPAHPERAPLTPPLSLRGVQAVVLWELHLGHTSGGYGVYMQIPVGGGKTLVFYLGALITGARRPLLFVPASLKKDTYDKFELYARYWKQPYPMPRIESFQQLTAAGSVNMLEAMRPDFMGADECDKAKDLTRSAGKRIGRYVDLVRGECTNLFGSGTNKRKSLRDDNHFMTWCLRERSPGFLTDEALSDACSALDEESKVGAGRLHPGALLTLADQAGVPLENPAAPSIGMLARAREGYRLRVEHTPGIVIHDQSECDVPITIDFVLPDEDPALEARFEWFRSTMMTPDLISQLGEKGEPVLMPDALSRHRHAQELGSGFAYYWDPPAPLEWKVARKRWHVFVADRILETERCPHNCRHKQQTGFCMLKPLDTEMAVANAYPTEPSLLEWRDVRPTFEPNSVPAWLSYSVVQSAARFAHEQWIQRGDTGIIWSKHAAFSQALSQATGFPFYGAKGERIDAYGRSMPNDTIESAIRNASKMGRPAPVAILSIDANLRGRNLQAYANNLNIGWEQAGTRVEQRLGRTHRSGQTRPVRDTIMVTCGETLDAFYKTLSEARFVKSQGLTHKILTARIDKSGLRAYPGTTFRYVRRD